MPTGKRFDESKNPRPENLGFAVSEGQIALASLSHLQIERAEDLRITFHGKRQFFGVVDVLQGIGCKTAVVGKLQEFSFARSLLAVLPDVVVVLSAEIKSRAVALDHKLRAVLDVIKLEELTHTLDCAGIFQNGIVEIQ